MNKEILNTLSDRQKSDMEITVLSFMVELKMFSSIYEDLMKNLNGIKLKGFNEYMEISFKYRNIASNITNIIATWEQQLYVFMHTFFNPNINNYYKTLKTKYIELLHVDTHLFNTIEEYRLLANVLKHGKFSNSYTDLKNMNSKFLEETTEYDYLKRGASFNTPVLNINQDTINEISEILLNFWKSFGIFK